eukprot:m.200071 g.200071  ORF g.200071 m.200071 type:complete len:553 (+) comp18779_c0_seq1:122-1780(+)
MPQSIMSTFSMYVLVASYAIFLAVSAQSDCSKVQLASGVVQGKVNGNAIHFLGVPFAAPPVGNKRWLPPQPVTPWQDTRDATEYAPACTQSKGVYGDFTKFSEDCLYLNFWIPADACSSNKTYPVMIFFHGGSYVSGTAMFPIYGGESAMHFDDTILIAANYRLGMFGYLGSDKLRAPTDNSTGNFGFQDQRAVMQWAQRNAESFHGDPSRVTIYGESAGAGSVSAHLVAPRSKGLFQRAIAESGPFAQWITAPLDVAERSFEQIAEGTGCSLQDDVVACLRALNASQLEAHRPRCNRSTINWAPVVDNVEFSAPGPELARQGLAHDVPVIMGTNRDEGTMFIDLRHNATEAEYLASAQTTFGTEIGSALVQQYPISKYAAKDGASAAWWALSHAWGDAFMACPARRSMQWLAQSPGRKSPQFFYFFDYELSVLKVLDAVKKGPYGVCHASELGLVFRVDELLVTKSERHLADTVVGLWQTFARDGAPTSPQYPWPAYATTTTPGANNTLSWDIKDDGLGDISLSIINDWKRDNCNFWDNINIPQSALWGQC